jgi:hypothetical protein
VPQALLFFNRKNPYQDSYAVKYALFVLPQTTEGATKTQETKMLTSAFDPKGDSRQPCVRSELEVLPGLLGGHLFLYERIATSSTPSNPLAASPELFPVSQSATDVANR